MRKQLQFLTLASALFAAMNPLAGSALMSNAVATDDDGTGMYVNFDVAYGMSHTKDMIAKDWTGITSKNADMKMSGETKPVFLEKPRGLIGTAEAGAYVMDGLRAGVLGFYYFNVEEKVTHASGIMAAKSDRELKYDTMGAMLQLSYEFPLRSDYCNLKLYGTGGIGAAYTKADLGGKNTLVLYRHNEGKANAWDVPNIVLRKGDSAEWSLAWNVGAGLRYFMHDSPIYVQAGYRFINSPVVKFNTPVAKDYQIGATKYNLGGGKGNLNLPGIHMISVGIGAKV